VTLQNPLRPAQPRPRSWRLPQSIAEIPTKLLKANGIVWDGEKQVCNQHKKQFKQQKMGHNTNLHKFEIGSWQQIRKNNAILKWGRCNKKVQAEHSIGSRNLGMIVSIFERW